MICAVSYSYFANDTFQITIFEMYMWIKLPASPNLNWAERLDLSYRPFHVTYDCAGRMCVHCVVRTEISILRRAGLELCKSIVYIDNLSFSPRMEHELVVLSSGNEASTLTLDDRRRLEESIMLYWIILMKSKPNLFGTSKRAMAHKPVTHILPSPR